MALRYGFFDSEITGYDAEGMPIFDRAEGSDLLATFISKIVSNGVLAAPGDCFQVIADGTMTVTVRPGFAILNGRFASDINNSYHTVAAASSQYKRIDRVVLRANYASRLCEIVIKQGQPSNSPVAPEVLQPDAGDYFELSLATISISSNQSQITQADITDTRTDSDVCGLVTQLIDHLETSVFYAQLEQFYTEFQARIASYEDAFQSAYNSWFSQLQSDANNDRTEWNLEFGEWFQRMKDQLSEDAAGSLQTQIDNKANIQHTHTKDEVGLGNVDNTADSEKSVHYAETAGAAIDQTARTTAEAAMPKTGGTFTGDVAAISANRAGSFLRNCVVVDSAGNEVSTNSLRFVRK